MIIQRLNVFEVFKPRSQSFSYQFLDKLSCQEAFQFSITKVSCWKAIAIISMRIFSACKCVLSSLKDLKAWAWSIPSAFQTRRLLLHLIDLISILSFPALGIGTIPFGYLLQTQFRIPETTQDVWKLGKKPNLVTSSGKQFQRLRFDSKLNRFLRKKLRDIKWAETVWNNYKTLLLPELQKVPDVIAKVENWIKLNCFNLGCSRLPFIEKMRKELPDCLHSAWNDFITSISCKEHSHNEQERSKRIVILTTQLGEKRVSDAILSHLKQAGREVSVVDVEQTERPYDPFQLYSGALSEPEIHTIVNVRQNHSEKAKRLWYCSTVAKKFIPDNSLAEVVKRIKELNPSLILSTRWTVPSEAAVAARLNVPVRIIHCDFGFTPHFKKGFRNASLVQFYVPASDIPDVPKDTREDEIQLLGYPIRDELKMSADVASIKKAWGIAPKDKVIFIMMGSEGSCKTKLCDLLTKIRASNRLPPTCVIIVCGNNTQMKTELQQFTATEVQRLKFIVRGWTDAKGISDIYNMADLYIGKTGGSTTAELMYMGVPALGFAEYEPEKNNLIYLVRKGLAKELDEDHLIEQINAVFSIKKIPIVKSLDWKFRLDRLIMNIPQ